MRELFYNTVAALGKILSLEATARVGSSMGRLFWRLVKSRRVLATEAIAFHLEKSPEEAKRMAKAAMRNNFISFFEIFQSPKVDWRFLDQRLEIATPENLAALQADTGPTVVATGHFGSWELINGVLDLLQTGRKKIIVMRPPKDLAMNRLLHKLRARPSVEVVDHRQATKPVLKYLRSNNIAAFLVDHNCMQHEAVFLPFLNKTAAVNMGPALLAVRTGATIWPSFLVRLPGQRFSLHVDKPLATSDLTGDSKEKVRQAAEFYTKAVERIVREYPEQWYWMHKRWKTQPGD